MRQQAAESDVVIVNHHLLCADASVRQSTYGEVIPDCHYAIIDEAHHLEDVATQYFGIAISNYRVDDLVRDAERVLNLGMIEDDDSELRRDRHAASTITRCTFFGALPTVRHARGGSEERLRIGAGWFGDVARRRPRPDRRARRPRRRDEEAEPAATRPARRVNEDAATLGAARRRDCATT